MIIDVVEFNALLKEEQHTLKMIMKNLFGYIAMVVK